MGLHFHVKFEADATYTEITELVKFDSVKFSTSLCNDKFKFSQDTVKAETIYDKATNDKFFSATKYLPCYVTYDLQDEQMYGYDVISTYGYSEGNNYGFLSPGRIFTGAIYPNEKETLRDYSSEGVSFEIVDNAYTIDKDCEAFSYPQLLSHTWKVFDPSDKAWSLIHQLLYKAGVDDSMISPVGSITKTVEHISKEEGDDTYLKIINELLYEHHHVAYFDRNGVFCIYDWGHGNIVVDDIITEADILDAGGVERKRNIIDYDGYKVIYKSLSTKEKGLVYREDIDEDGKLLLEDGYFPVDGAIKDIYQSFTNKYLPEDAKILNTFNHILEVTKDDGVVIQSEFYESTQAKVLLKNVLTEDQRLFQLDIRADVIYEDGEEEFTVPSTAKKLDKDITFNYIFNESDAEEFANSLYNNIIKNGSYTYTFLSTNNYSIGRKYNIITRDYDKNVLVIGKEWDDYTKAYKYNCIGVAQRVVQVGRIKSFRMSSTQANVFSTAQLRLMKRSKTVPNAYSGGKVSYTFSTGAISFENGNNDGWALTPLTSDGAVYVIYASANSQALTDEILANEWTAPVMLLEEAVAGKDGANVQTIFIFNTSPSIPSLPSVEVTHNFKTGLTSGLNNEWKNQKDIVDGDKIWVSTATAFSYSLTDTIPASEWSEPVVWKQKGATGDIGPAGQGIDSITEEYYVSTSKTTQTGGSWSSSTPTWSTGNYLWTRSKIVYKNPADTKYTTPVCDSSWEAVNEIQIGGRNLLLDSEYHNNTSSTYLGTTVTFVNDTQYDTGTNYRLRINIPSSIKEGEEFVFSFAFNRTYSVHEIIVATPSKTYTFMSTVDDVGVFKRYSFNFIKGTDTYIEIYTTATTANWTLNSKEYKIEKGNQATDWTPAPEELEGIVGKSVKTSDVEYYLSTSSTTLSGGSWLTTAPQWVDGKFMWTRTKTTLNDGTVSYSPSEGGTSIQAMIPPQPKMIALTGDTPTILYSSRGELKTNEVLFTVTPTNIDYADIVWTCNIGDEYLEDILDEFGNPIVNQKAIVAEDITEGPVVVTVYAIIDGITYSASYSVAVVSEGLPKPMYLDARTDIPLVTEEGPLAKGDYFLYIGEYDGPNAEPVPPTDKTNPLYLNPTPAETNEFIYGRMYEYIGKDSIGTDLWKETRKSECFASAQKDALEIAKNSGVYLYVAVVVAQLGLFNDLLVANKLSSTNYDEYKEEDKETNPASPNYNKIIGLDGKEHEVGEPKKGFRLDGPEDIIKAFAMEAYNSKIFGTVESTGFKTLTGTEPVTIPVGSIPKTLWKYSDMFELVPDQDYLYNISGTIEGFSFDKAARRTNKRIKLAEHGYESESISAGEDHAFTKLTFTPVFGNSFYVEYSGYYEGFASNRLFTILAEDNENSRQLESLPTSYTVAKIYTLPVPSTTGYGSVIHHYSGAGWGKKSSHVSYHRVYSSRAFNGLVLVNGISSYKVIDPKPNAYYPNTITWNIGANNQNTLSNYVSGTEFYNKFYELPSIADGYVNAGKIKVKRIGQPLTEYTVTRLVKDGNGISFYTNLGIVRVDKFSEETSSGVYEHLEITQDIEFKTVPDGIEVKSVLPWGTFINNVDNVSIGTVDARFESGYFKYLDILTNMLIRGTLNVTGAISGASVDTGFGANKVYKTSTQTIEAQSTTAQLSAMDIGEVRYVYYSVSGNPAYLRTPAGGNFYISLVVGSAYPTGGSYAGNTNFATFLDSRTVTGVFIIRRNS